MMTTTSILTVRNNVIRINALDCYYTVAELLLNPVKFVKFCVDVMTVKKIASRM